jgi:hypothetical protein
MKDRTRIAILIYSMTQGVLFGAGVVAVLAAPLQGLAAYLIPAVMLASAFLAAPLAYWLAPRLMEPWEVEADGAGLPAAERTARRLSYDRRLRDPRPLANASRPAREPAERETRRLG